MKKTHKDKCSPTERYVLGEHAFAAITAVEGIRLDAASRQRLAALDALDLSAEERRARVVRAFEDAISRR